MNDTLVQDRIDIGRRLSTDVLDCLKGLFVGKDEVIDLLGVCLVGGENLFILGPPGTAKSALVKELASHLDGKIFDYLLTRFTEPNEIFGPFDIRKLRDGELVTNTEGMLPEASFIFLDELLNANSAILNSLLMVLNERVFRRGRETRKLPALMVVGASNHLPEDDALAALYDRFLVRVRCDNVPSDQLLEVIDAGWRLDNAHREQAKSITVEDVGALNKAVSTVDLQPIKNVYVELIHRLRHAGISVTDRRAVKLQRLIAASALLAGRNHAKVSDLWVMRYIWDVEEQREVLDTIVQNIIDSVEAAADDHPRARSEDDPDPEILGRNIGQIQEQLAKPDLSDVDRVYLQDRLGVLSGKCQWVRNDQQREYLTSMINNAWSTLGVDP